MPARKTLITAATAGAFLVGGAAVANVTTGGSEPVPPVDLPSVLVASTVVAPDATVGTQITVEPGSENPASPPVSTPSASVVPGLREVRGTLALIGDEFVLDGRELDVGPDRWVMTTVASGDLDGDGTVETWWDEVRGAVGRTVTVLGEVDDDDIDAYQINGLAVRSLSGPAPWSGDRDRDDDYYDDDDDDADDMDDRLPVNTRISLEDAKRLALAEVPGTVREIDLDIDRGVVYWDVKIRSVSGAVFYVEIDADSGRVILIDRD